MQVAPAPDAYANGRRAAWFAFAMTFALMLFDFIDRQVVAALFPSLKAAWALSDGQLGSLVSIVSLVVAMGSVPVALLADRTSRVRSIVAMAATWSCASVACMFTRDFGQLLAARAVVGLGEAGYGSVGAALIASVFPARWRSALMGAFFTAASLGSVLGVLLGGAIDARWGWRAAFGIVGIPGLLLSVLYLGVRDVRSARPSRGLDDAPRSGAGALRLAVATLARIRTLRWICLGGPLQLVMVSALWSWLPSFLVRVQRVSPEQSARLTALVVLAGAVGGFVWGAVVDRAARHRPCRKLTVVAILCLLATAILVLAFEADLPAGGRFAAILAGGFVMTCSAGPITAVVFDVVPTGLRSTGAAVLALAQNLFGLAVGPVVAGLLSDRWGLQAALGGVSLFGAFAALAFAGAARSHESDARRAGALPPSG